MSDIVRGRSGYDPGEAPSPACARGRHVECGQSDDCTCRCHHFNDNGLKRVEE